MKRSKETGLYRKLAGTLAALFAVVLVVISVATVVIAFGMGSWNVAQAREDVRRAFADGAAPENLTRYWSIGLSHGGVVLVNAGGRVVSAPDRILKTGTVWRGAPAGYVDYASKIGAFDVHVLLPPSSTFSGLAKVLLALIVLIVAALAAAAFLVTRIVSRYVKARDLLEQTKALKLAADIQTSAMPQTFPPFPDHHDFDIYATMQPAKEVGGDFYDFYFAGPGRLVFLVADVSGKGVPAALFMMRAKSLLKGLVQTGLPLAEAVAKANASLCEGNATSVFVTAWIGEIDLKTGRVKYVDAGHNPPVLRRAGGAAGFVRDEVPGLFLGALAGVAYVERELQLASGDSLYLYTDGITEQVDAKNELFGEERLVRLLGETKLAQRPLLAEVARAVTHHAGIAEQSDDRTQLELVWRGDCHL